MELDKEAIAEFLSLGYVLGDRTFIKGKKKKIEIDIPKLEVFDADISDVEDALKKSIEAVTKGKDRIGVLLSGGKDARLLIALVNSLGLDVTGVNVGDKRNRDEEKIAAKVAKALGVPFKFVNIPDDISPSIVSEIGSVSDGLISFSGCSPIYLIRDDLAKDFDIVLAGTLMTEVMDTCEYRWYDSKNPLDVMKRKHLKGSKLLVPEYAKKVEENFLSAFRDKSLEEIILETEYKNRSTAFVVLNQLMDVVVDTPVRDKDVVSSVFSLPLEQRINGRLATDIMKKSFPSLAAIPMSKTRFPLFFPWWLHYGTYQIKDRVSYYKRGKKIWNGEPRTNKMGMWDQGYVYKYKIGDYVKESISSLDFDILDKDFIKDVLEKHFAEEADKSGYIPRLLTLKHWLDNNN